MRKPRREEMSNPLAGRGRRDTNEKRRRFGPGGGIFRSASRDFRHLPECDRRLAHFADDVRARLVARLLR